MNAEMNTSQLGAAFDQAIGWFQNPDMRLSAIILAVLAFIAGILVTCILCRLCRRHKCTCSQTQYTVRAPYKKPMKGDYPKTYAPPADGSVEIYVGNLSYELTDEILRKEFSAFGKVNSARIVTNRYTGRSKGFGFVHMPNAAEASAAVKGLNDKEILGRKLKCNEARNVG